MRRAMRAAEQACEKEESSYQDTRLITGCLCSKTECFQ